MYFSRLKVVKSLKNTWKQSRLILVTMNTRVEVQENLPSCSRHPLHTPVSPKPWLCTPVSTFLSFSPHPSLPPVKPSSPIAQHPSPSPSYSKHLAPIPPIQQSRLGSPSSPAPWFIPHTSIEAKKPPAKTRVVGAPK